MLYKTNNFHYYYSFSFSIYFSTNLFAHFSQKLCLSQKYPKFLNVTKPELKK